MKKIIICLLAMCCCFIGVNYAIAAERIWHEDCETTNYSTHFLEEQFGSNYSSYWSELTSAVTQSAISHTGNYSMVYDPIVSGNPHTNIGAGDVPYGNLSNFDLSIYHNRYWYFRWYQRWENSTYSGYVKLWYLGGFGDYYYLCKSSNTSAIIVIRDEPGGNRLTTYNGGFYSPGLDDGIWHKMEIYIDFGTGAADGETWIRVDDTEAYSANNLAFANPTSPVNNIMWPSNSSGNKSGSQRTWIDDQEIFILDGPADIPPDSGGESADNPPSVTITNPSTPSYSTSSSSFGLSGTSSDDNGVTSISWSNNRGGSGTVSGNLASWSVSGITLLEGDNVITITAQDTAGQTSNDVVIVTYSLTSAPLAPQGYRLEN